MSLNVDPEFWFDDQLTADDLVNARVVNLPAGIQTKLELFTYLASGLDFPAYFGWNWDALEECLNDLSWVGPYRIVLLHEGIPFDSALEDRAIYLEILRMAVNNWKTQPSHELLVIFPRQDQIEVTIP